MRRIASAIAVILLVALAAPASAHQWVAGTVTQTADYTAYSANYGIYVNLAGMTWGAGDTQNGPTACTSGFRIAAGQQNVTSELQGRFLAILMLAKGIGQKALMYIDTSTGPECAVQIVGFGQTVP